MVKIMKFLLLLFINLYFVKSLILFPQFTVLQFTVAIAIPIEVPDRKLFLNVAVQCNYNLPFRVSDFAHPPFWAGTRSFFGNTISDTVGGAVNSFINHFQTNVTRAKRDLSAGEIYNTLQDVMAIQGYHDDCLQKSICELAKMPIHHDDDDILMEVLHFILTPSVHQSFSENELDQKLIFEDAERLGISGGDCHLKYPNCPVSPLDHVTHSIEHFD